MTVIDIDAPTATNRGKRRVRPRITTPVAAPPEPTTYLEMLAAGWTLWGYADLHRMTGRQEQTYRKALWRRNEHIATEGKARPKDIPEPTVFRSSGRRAQPYWRDTVIEPWLRQTGQGRDEDGNPLPHVPGGSVTTRA